MDFTGLVTKLYKKNRRITDEERENRLWQKSRLDVEPSYQLAVVKINSTFLESVDRYFDSRGALTFGCLVILAFCTWFIWGTGGAILGLYFSGEAALGISLGFVAAIVVLCGALAFWTCWMARKELFRLTYYPIRLNRRNRVLYVHKTDGDIIAVPWDEVFFTLSPCSSMYGRTWDIRGLVLNADAETVRHEFAFAPWSSDQDELRSHWEFLRRYMDDGPAALVSQIEFCMPVDGKRESFRAGLERIFAGDSGNIFFYWLMSPINAAVACCRWLVMKSCKVPTWPREIEDACRLEPSDLYARDSSINPPNLR
ncbi:DUF6708 domain-containing protein [Cupriavidus cauae]|uniref:DUF6708 domain-containing protein n=1 Tax=Cupriavidus cauae TaxID=2608999 RepID=A0A5M8AR67_9BURK|nr:DUF6708 domain-containing protein [Cupriavidus cauae]KAA6125192.1 hypothetical protein F1599_10340 [Cupriavidus cauae]